MSELQQPGGISMEQSTHSALYGEPRLTFGLIFLVLVVVLVGFKS